jgi:hypothetical protein
VAVATAALGIALLCLAGAGRWVLDRRRLAGWETAWAAAASPQWARRFRSRANRAGRPVTVGRAGRAGAGAGDGRCRT